ncbi:ATP-binding protein [Sphaerospermopsis sp. LEGE 08334]|uniref:AAA family ATPase n=1 Tax=Sphaerospermopsis sp. LEGE 08334 TaxID=1828651 RepID=UPI00187FFCE7|nr:ATP-binding protein [Sphaerospermopsis sp. LEGE 08334]MBE9055863.1 AAA family ATPase [Sphaerospermopsis sp. LEGE 08334]
MEKLTIKNFLNINDVEFNLSKINIIIGQEASGKSVIAKLVYFFKTFLIEYRNSIFKTRKKSEFDKSIIKNFKEIFPEYSWNFQQFDIIYQINYESQNYYIRLYTKQSTKNKYTLILEYSEYLINIRRKLLSEYTKTIIDDRDKTQNNSSSISKLNIGEFIDEIFSKYILSGKNISNLDLLTFIPAGRSFFAVLQSNVFSFLSENITIEYFLKEFGSAYERAKNLYQARQDINLLEYKDDIDELVNKIIVGKYIREKGEDWIYTNDDRKINLSHSSSGQQEALPMALILAILPFFTSSHRVFIIEEPEAHLFPISQKHIISLISQVFNTTERKHKFIITTHSPYILTAFNNLIQAGNTLKALKEKSEQDDLIRELFKIVPENQMLDINDIAAYTIKNGMIESLINEENHLIDTNIIDDVSNEFSMVFEKLIDLEFGE